MDLVTLALATTLICQVPANKKVVGLWESTAVSRGGIGHNFEFRDDGSYTTAVTVIVDLTYDIKDGSFYMSHNKDEAINYEKGAKIEITESGFTLTGEDGEKEIKTKETPSARKTIVGKYKYRHYSGGIAYEKYTSGGCPEFCVNGFTFNVSLTLRHPLIELDGKPVQRGLPVADGHRPFLGYVSKRQIEQLGERLIARE